MCSQAHTQPGKAFGRAARGQMFPRRAHRLVQRRAPSHSGERQQRLPRGLGIRISIAAQGPIGTVIPAAIGASITKRGRTICVTGDGSAQFNIQELATIVKNNCQLIIFIVNNGGYASIRNTQKAFFSMDFIGTTPDSGLSFPNWEKLADAYGINYQKIANKAGLIEGIERALTADGPLFVEVICQEGQVIMPAVSSHRDSTGALIADPLHEMSPSLTGKEYIVHLN